jgi:hypothetical protein
MAESRLDLRAGDVVEVRSREEILATLDPDGTLDALPFMPEMLEFCGKRFTVAKRADKTCDTIQHSGLRRMTDTVHLEGTRCSGAAHGRLRGRVPAVLEGAVAETHAGQRRGRR